MKRAIFFLLLFSSFALFAKSPTIQSIALVPYNEERAALESQEVIAIHVPCNQVVLGSVLQNYIGAQISEENLQALKESISAHFMQEGNSLCVVQIPEQNVSSGRVTLTLLSAKVGRVCVEGNAWFWTSSILSAFALSENEHLEERDLLNNAAWVNRNPFLHTSLILSKGEELGSTDIKILTKDRFPARFYVGADNTGNSFSGNTRMFTGLNFSLGLNTLISYQFTSGPDFPEFLAHYGNITYSLPCKHEISFYGGYATMHPEIENFQSKGIDAQASFRYKIPFKPLYTPFQQQILFGADFKETNSSLFFLGALPSGEAALIPVENKTAQLLQFMLGYQLESKTQSYDLEFRAESYFSPAKMLPNQTPSDYNALRLGANTRYLYARASLGSHLYQLPLEFSLSFLLRGQAATGALLPSEQYRLGGYDTVRGYQEGVYLADNAVIANVELRTKSWSPLNRYTSLKDALYFLVFLDTAYGYNFASTPAFPKDAWLMGVGPGMRYSIGPYLIARCDYGFRIHNTSFGNSQLGRVHFSLVLAY
jgi:hemolysin activation/secretion protein